MNNPRVGYRFIPFDEEIINYFLKHKMDGNDFLVDDDVREIDLCKHEPWDLPRLCADEESHDRTWYFFCRRERNKRPRRATKVGYWKSTGQDRTIKAGRKVIGTKKSLGFHIGRTGHGKRSEWTIHEYIPSIVLPDQTPYVLCKLMKKSPDKADASACYQHEPLDDLPSDNENYLFEIPDAEVDQEQLLELVFGRNLRDHPPAMQPQASTSDNIFSSLGNAYLNASDGLRSSSAFSERKQNEIEFADSLLDFSDELNTSNAPVRDVSGETVHTLLPSPGTRAYNENINNVYMQVVHQAKGQFSQLPGTSNVQDGHARSREFQQRQSVALSGTLPSLNHSEKGWEDIVATQRVAEAYPPAYYINVISRDSRESSSIGSTTPEEEIYAIEQEWPESSSGSSTSPEEEIYFIGQESPESSNITIENQSARRSQFQSELPHRLSKKLTPKIQKPSAILLSQKKSSDDSGKTKRLLVESEKDHNMVDAKASSTLKTLMSSLIRLETLPMSHRQSPPSVFLANVLVGLVLFVAVSREVLIFH